MKKILRFTELYYDDAERLALYLSARDGNEVEIIKCDSEFFPLLSEQKQDEGHEGEFPEEGEGQEQPHFSKHFRGIIQLGEGVEKQPGPADVEQDYADGAEVFGFDLADLAEQKAGKKIQQREEHVAEGDGETDHQKPPHIKYYIIAFFVRTAMKVWNP